MYITKDCCGTYFWCDSIDQSSNILQNMLMFARKYSESHQNSLNHISGLLFLSKGRILHVVQPCVLLTLSFLGNYRTHLWLITMVSSYVESNQGDGHSKKVSRDPSQNYQTMKLSFLINLSYLPSCFLVYFSVSTFNKTVNFAEGVGTPPIAPYHDVWYPSKHRLVQTPILCWKPRACWNFIHVDDWEFSCTDWFRDKWDTEVIHHHLLQYQTESQEGTSSLLRKNPLHKSTHT